jgi:hypothetical protein
MDNGQKHAKGHYACGLPELLRFRGENGESAIREKAASRSWGPGTPQRRTKPILDPQKWDELNEHLSEACRTGEEITLVLWGPYENHKVVGAIVKLDILAYRIFIAGQWVKLASILDVLRI